jgi:hypothetical protein
MLDRPLPDDVGRDLRRLAYRMGRPTSRKDFPEKLPPAFPAGNAAPCP